MAVVGHYDKKIKIDHTFSVRYERKFRAARVETAGHYAVRSRAALRKC